MDRSLVHVLWTSSKTFSSTSHCRASGASFGAACVGLESLGSSNPQKWRHCVGYRTAVLGVLVSRVDCHVSRIISKRVATLGYVHCATVTSTRWYSHHPSIITVCGRLFLRLWSVEKTIRKAMFTTVTVMWLRQSCDAMQHRAISCSQLWLRLWCNCDVTATRNEGVHFFIPGCTKLQPITKQESVWAWSSGRPAVASLFTVIFTCFGYLIKAIYCCCHSFI